MEITLDILIYFLRALHPQIIRQTRKDICFIGAYRFYVTESEMEAGGGALADDTHRYLYIANLSELYTFRHAITADMTVLASGDCELSKEQMKELSCDFILVDGINGVPFLLNRMIYVFGFLANWDKNMHIAALEGKSVQDLLELSKEVLEHPVLIFDAGFDVLAFIAGRNSAYTGFHKTLSHGYTDPDTMKWLRENDIFSQLSKGKVLIAPAAHDRSMTNLYIAFYSGQTVLGYACIFLDREKVEEGYLDLVRLFMENMTFCLKRDYESQRFGQMMYETFLRNLMNPSGTSKEQLSEQLQTMEGLTEYGRFVLGVIDFSDAASVPMPFLARQLANEFWDVRPFIYEGQICLLRIRKEDSETLTVMDEREESRLDQILVNYSFTFGISNEFSHITDLRYACRQAATAIRWGRLKGKKLCRYSEYYFYDLLEVMEKQMPVKQLIAPLYRQMQAYDNKNKTRYLPMILKYLACNCNATHAAEELYLHRNTIRKAVALAEERWQISLEDTQVKLDLLMSEMIEQYREVKGICKGTE